MTIWTPSTVQLTEDKWQLTLPWTKPPMSLNDRMDRWTKARWTKTLRQTAWALAKQAKIPPLGACDVVLLYVPRDRRRRDEDNLTATLKPLADGLVDAGVVVDDTPDFMRKDPRLGDPDPKHPRLVLIVERRGRAQAVLDHGFTPGRFNPDACRVQLARCPCPWPREDHDQRLAPEEVDAFGRIRRGGGS